ncbi:hypothetical protein PIB30_024267 [Stylosanthes scabra]|uniref:Uncharacterized protein n=1 Tax=Stylosanthes scabra TaxID=79078 RepID=A0ABU6VAJ8_9FABA|nr:hypothetical protein [Stylosanthes scabra]
MVKGNGKPSKKGKAVNRWPAKDRDPTKDVRISTLIFKRFNIIDNTIHVVAGEVEITTEKIGKAFGLKYTGTTYPEKVNTKELSVEDEHIFKFFQGKSQAAIKELIFKTPVDTKENRDKFKRAFLLYIQKCFFIPTSAPNVTPRALPTIFDLQNTRKKNWALHIHNFLLEEIEKAKENNASSVSGCCFALMVIYFHKTYFGKNCQDAKAQPPWGLIRTAMLVDERQGKSTKKSKKVSSSTSESEYVGSSHESESEYEANSEQTMSQVVVRVERTRPRRNDSASKRQPLARKTISRSDSDDRHTIAQVMSLAKKKRKGLEEEGSKCKRPKKAIEVPPVDSAIASLGDNESNAGGGNLLEETNEQPQQQPPPQQSPPQEEEPPHHQPPPQQEQHQPSKQQQEFIDISSSSEGEPEPTPIRVLVPKAEPDMQYSPGSDDDNKPQPQPIKLLVPKIEDHPVSSPSSKLITEVLMSMGDDGVLDP